MPKAAHNQLILWAVLLGCFIALFWQGLVEGQVPAFRDAFHFYYPQAVWLDDCASHGEYFPQWNRDEGLGLSVAGQVSTALYYPLRVLWFVPGLDVGQRFSLVIVAHLLLAFASMRYAARKLSLEPELANLAGISYSLSCPVFFQHNNLIYLCSAAWIGFAVGALIQFVRDLKTKQHPLVFRAWIVFSLATAMMLLAGDPHTAVNCVVVATAGLVGLAIFRQAWSQLALSLGWLAASVVFIACLTSIQWIPAARWSLQSDRLSVASSTEVGTESLSDVTEHRAVQEFLARIKLDSRPIYDFSLSPWHLLTHIWPTLGGHYLPQNARLFSAIPAEGRMWIPSIYCGIIPAFAVLLGLGRLRQSHRIRWLTTLAVVAGLAALGNYSLIWLAREIGNALNWQWLVARLPADQALTVYGLLSECIPGYSAFRYPAKWTVWYAAAIALLASSLLQIVAQASQPTAAWHVLKLHTLFGRLLMVGSVAVLLAGIGFAVLGAPSLEKQFPYDPLLGRAQWSSVGLSLIAAAVPMTLLLLVGNAARSWRAVCWITLVEMVFIAFQWTAFVAAPSTAQRSAWVANLPPEDSFVWSNISQADIRKLQPDSGSLAERQSLLQQQFLVGKLAQAAQLRNLGSIQSVESSVTSKIRLWLTYNDRLQLEQPAVEETLAALGVTHRLVRLPQGGLTWQPIANPQPLCEIVVDGSARTEVQWKWTAADRMTIRLNGKSPATLLVRQLSDGGWSAVARGDATTELPIAIAPSPFVEIEVPAGVQEIDLRRKWLW